MALTAARRASSSSACNHRAQHVAFVRCQANRPEAKQQAGVERRQVVLGGAGLVLSAGMALIRPSSSAAAGSPYSQGPGVVAFTQPTAEVLKGVDQWPIWEHQVDAFDYVHDLDEDCYFLEGEVIVTPKGGKPVVVKAGDYVTFPKGLQSRWLITKAVRKHYFEYQ